MLGSLSEADDAVQDALLRLSRADTSEVENLRGWLTTIVARVALNMLRSRRVRVTRRGAALAPRAIAIVEDVDGRFFADVPERETLRFLRGLAELPYSVAD
jgi:DNA-directed RNA polymerase specialized sigma24 family protein